MLLFPDETAVTVDEFNAQLATEGLADMVVGGAQGAPPKEMTVVVLNGTWSNVKPILKHVSL